MIDEHSWKTINTWCKTHEVTLVAVSKTKSAADILALYELGQRDFGENYVQELVTKQQQLPEDIRWHYIGHLQTNKVKHIASFVHLIHAADSEKLLQAIQKEAAKQNRVIDVLLQLRIAAEETKYGMQEEALYHCAGWYQAQRASLGNIRVCGLMGMASFTDQIQIQETEFRHLKTCFDRLKQLYFSEESCFSICSMGMSNDYQTAVAAGSNLIRIGSLLFGAR